MRFLGLQKLSLAAALLLGSMSAFAELPVKIGLKGGYSSSKLTTKLSQEYKNGNLSSYHVGAALRFNIKNFYVQPEGYFTSKGGKLSLSNQDAVKFDTKMIDVPLLLGVKLLNLKVANLRLNAGPVFSFVTDKKITDPQNTAQFNKDNIKNTWGLQYGLGVDVLKFSLDVRLERGFSDLYKSDVATINSSANRMFLVSLGFWIL
ncbi:MAG: PorT family protein [Bacteroidales bacterium]|jgi:hypothetical protein|nr:PorT family protein [Bacteroidales bacterium]